MMMTSQIFCGIISPVLSCQSTLMQSGHTTSSLEKLESGTHHMNTSPLGCILWNPACRIRKRTGLAYGTNAGLL